MKIRIASIVLCAAIIIPVLALSVPEEVAPGINPASVATGDITRANMTGDHIEGEAIIGFYGPMAFSNTKIVNEISAKYGIVLVDTEQILSAALYTNVDNETFIEIAGDTNVKYICRNHVAYGSEVPNDPSWPIQYGPESIGAPTAWDNVTGSPTFRVAVLDSGIDYDHPDLEDNYLAIGYDWVNDDDDPMDDHGHGTHCAGIIGGVGNNTAVMAGVAWQVKVFAEKVLDSANGGDYWGIGKGIVHAVVKEAKVISMSLGGGTDDDFLRDSVEFAYDHGRLLVACSHNDAGGPIRYPAAYPEVIAVSAIDQNDVLAPFSNVGPEQELAAPGVDILSLGLTYRYSSGEKIYRDDDENNVVSADDERLNLIPEPFLAANTLVANNDPDEDAQWNLMNFNADEVHTEAVNANNQYDNGERLYVDLDADNLVSVGDMRLTGFTVGLTRYPSGSTVIPFNPDIGTALVAFNANETHTTIAYMSGTSMAAPHVSGVAALTWIRNPELDRDEVRHLLQSTADDLGAVGQDNNFGHGKVNASQCVENGSFRYSIEVTPSTQTIVQGGSVAYTITLGLVQGPGQNVDLKLDDMYPLNPDLAAVIDPVSGIPPFQATLTITATDTAAFISEILRINSTCNILGRDFIRFSNLFSIAITVAPGDIIWIKTSDTDDGTAPVAGKVHTSPDIWSDPDPPEGGKTNTLNVKVRNHGTTDSGPVLVQTWFGEWSPLNNILELPSLGPETIDNIPPDGEKTVTFDWYIPEAFSEHICVFAQAWRPGFEPFSNQFNVRNNNNIAQRNFNAVFPTSPYSTDLTIKNPTGHMLSMSLYATAPGEGWVVDFCRPSTLRGGVMETPLKIPSGEEIELTMTIIPPTDNATGTVSLFGTIDGYEELYTDLSGFDFNVEVAPPDDEPEEPQEIIDLIKQNIKIVIAVALVVIVILIVMIKRR